MPLNRRAKPGTEGTGCWICGPFDQYGKQNSAKSSEACAVAFHDDQVSGYMQHRHFACPRSSIRTYRKEDRDRKENEPSDKHLDNKPSARDIDIRVINDDDGKEILKSCSIILGLHPDQPTGMWNPSPFHLISSHAYARKIHLHISTIIFVEHCPQDTIL